MDGGRPCAWRAGAAAGLGPLPGGLLGSTGRPCAYVAAVGRFSKILSYSAVSGRPAGPGWPGMPARACTGLLRPLGWWPAGAGCKRTCDRQ